MKKAENSIKPQFIEITNFKNIAKKEVNIGGRSFIVLGPNEAGKSSFIQAITGSLNSKMLPSEVLTDGEESGRVILKLSGTMHGQEEEYTIDFYFSKKNKKGTLKLFNSKGEEVKSPATKIKDIIGAVSFDITKWINDPKETKLKTFKKVAGCEEKVDIINADIKRLKGLAKTKTDRAGDLEGALKNHGYSQDEISRYSIPVPMEKIQGDIDVVSKNQQIWDNVNNQLQGMYQQAQNAQEAINKSYEEKKRIAAEIDRLVKLGDAENAKISQNEDFLKKTNERIAGGEEWKINTPRPTMDEVNKRLSEATSHNEHYNRISQLSTQQTEMISLKEEVEKIKAQVAKRESDRDTVIQESQLPIPNMRFTDDDIYINNLPLEEGQQNTQTLFDIGIEVAIALNPNLKVIFLHEASLFDKAHLKAAVDKIESRGYMVIAEFVKWEGGNELEIAFTEDVLK